MTRSSGGSRMPGATLAALARVIFSEPMLSGAVRPTIADLQEEVRAAGRDRLARVRAYWRGYRAFCSLVLVAPFASWPSPARDAGRVAFPDLIPRLAAASIGLVLVAIVGPVVGGWLAAATAGGAVVAIAIHRWYDRHPSFVPEPGEAQPGTTPQINFSSTAVAGNIGGLIFVVGSVFIVAVGVPSLVWFLFAALMAGGLCAWALARWHTSHPKQGLPENQIVLR